MMKKAHGFVRMTIQEFKHWIDVTKTHRKILSLQIHHTWIPNYSSFNGNNHFDIQLAMKHYHIKNNRWDDIGQHLTVFPDGSILTGRSLENDPAGIYGFNINSICIENIGDFDHGRDQITSFHYDAIIKVTAMLCEKFLIPINSDSIVYHHWFDATTGKRNNGDGENNKSCPGTNFFGGNSVSDCQRYFLPLVSAQLSNGFTHKDDLK